jgi:hypothetical protein
MSQRDSLHTATDLLTQAAGATDGETSQRLENFSNRVERWANGEQDPDHGAMAQVLLKLDEIAGDADEEVAETIQEARSAITAYRKTVEGV